LAIQKGNKIMSKYPTLENTPPVICPRCKRRAEGWPLRRADICSPKNWVNCIRDPYVILAAKA